MKTNLNRERASETAREPAGSRWQGLTSTCQAAFQELKETLTRNLAAEFGGLLDEQQVRQVVNEADALAAITSFPGLFLPMLAEEKIRAVAKWEARQQQVRSRRPAFTAAI
jgi:hypothetical protein